MSEGRNNLEHGGLSSVEGVAEWQDLTLGVWYAVGDRESYDELNVFIEYGFELGPLEASVGYTRLEFFKDDEFDNEFSVGLALNDVGCITPGLDYTYSTEANGGFLEISLRTEMTLFDERLTLEPYVLEGFDFDYASEDYDGPNNFQAGIDFNVALTEQLSFVGSLAQTWAHKDVKNDDLGDVFWVSVGLSSEF